MTVVTYNMPGPSLMISETLALAAFVTTVTRGIAVQSKAGLDRATLELFADEALSCWPFRFSPSPEAEMD